MKTLYLHGRGACSLEADRDFVEGLGRLDDIPIKDYSTPALRRRYGRVTKLMYVAAGRALADAGIEDPSECSLVTCTAMGEVQVCLDLLVQIHETRGARIGPALVPNSVHNAPAGHLSIGMSNRKPSVTVSQGWLSAEAGIQAAADLLAMDPATRVLLVAGDEADPGWIDRLEGSIRPDWAADLRAEAFQEGAVALVLGSGPGGGLLGTIEGGVERAADPLSSLRELARYHSSAGGPKLEIRARVGAGGEEIAAALNAALDETGAGTSQTGPLISLLRRMADPSCERLLLLGRELDEFGYLRWSRL